MRKAKKRILIAVAAVVVILAVLLLNVMNGLKEAIAVPVGSIDLSAIADGEYTGSYDYKRWSATVSVRVNDHKIESIQVVNDVRAAEITNCADEIISRVIDAQDIQVDVVSGATATSKAYLKAIEDALSQ